MCVLEKEGATPESSVGDCTCLFIVSTNLYTENKMDKPVILARVSKF